MYNNLFQDTHDSEQRSSLLETLKTNIYSIFKDARRKKVCFAVNGFQKCFRVVLKVFLIRFFKPEYGF